MFFQLTKTDPNGHARRGLLLTGHGPVNTPVFMPVGTLATVKTLSPRDLEELGAEIILGNTYHLYMRPGCGIVEQAGGLHRFMSWPKPILTDSGGFQVYSLARLRKITDEGVEFQSHIDGSAHIFRPEDVIDYQRKLGSDIMMPLDVCGPHDATENDTRQSMERTLAWAEVSKKKFIEVAEDSKSVLFGIVQGGMFKELRRVSCLETAAINFPGYAVGGLSVGEDRALMYDILAYLDDLLPRDKPRYLMGVGEPVDLVTAIGLGFDMFDCVMPTRNARNGTLFTRSGKINIRNVQFQRDFTPIEESCPCYTCRNFTRAYLRHLMAVQEILGLSLNTIHNISFMLRLIADCRKHIDAGTYGNFQQAFYEAYHDKKTISKEC